MNERLIVICNFLAVFYILLDSIRPFGFI